MNKPQAYTKITQYTTVMDRKVQLAGHICRKKILVIVSANSRQTGGTDYAASGRQNVAPTIVMRLLA